MKPEIIPDTYLYRCILEVIDLKYEEQTIKTNGKIIMESGTEDFSLEKLSKQPEIKGFDLFVLSRKEEEIFEELLLNLEKETKELVVEISSGHDSPSE